MLRIFLVSIILIFCTEIKAQNSYMFLGYNGTVKSPVGFSYGGKINKTIFNMFARFSPMGLERLTGTNVDKDFYIQNGQLVDDSDGQFQYFFRETGREYIRRFSIGYQYGRQITPKFFWYAGLGYGAYMKQREYDKFHLGSYSDTYGVVDKDKSAKGVEMEAGFLLVIADNFILQGGLSTVNIAFKRVGVDPGFGIMFLNQSGGNRIRKWGKYSIRNK